MGSTFLRRRAGALGLVSAALIGALLVGGCTPSATAPDAHQAKTPPVWSPGASSASPTPAAETPAGDWLRFGYDPARSGVDLDAGAISPDSVSKLHRLWRVRLPTVADSSPIYLHHLTFADGSTHDVLYLTTLQGQLVAVDAASGAVLWTRQPKGPKITNSSPVASVDGRDVFSYGLDGYVHEYDATTGDEVTTNGWPVRITRMTGTEKESSALNITSTQLYATTSGYIGDAPPYQGHVVVAPLAPSAQHPPAVFNSLCANLGRLLVASDCSSEQSGIWARGGAVVDPVTGNIFVTTGNGPYSGNTGGHDWGDSVLELSPDGSRLLDAYTPTDQSQLNDNDTDLGSDAVGIVPKIASSMFPYLAVQGGKDALLRLLNRQNLSGRGGPGHLGGEVQTVPLHGCGTATQPLVWQHGGTVWIIVDGVCGMDAFTIEVDHTGLPSLHEQWSNRDANTSPVLVGGVLFAAQSGAVRAYNPLTGDVLWSSAAAHAGGSIGAIHWQSPIVVNNVLYIPDQDGYLSAYGM